MATNNESNFRPQPKTQTKAKTTKAKAATKKATKAPAKAPAKAKAAANKPTAAERRINKLAATKDATQPPIELVKPDPNVTPPPSPLGQSQDLNDDLDRAVSALRAGSYGQLVFGGLLHKWNNEGRDLNQVERLLAERGVSMPSRSRRSMWLGTYTSWVLDSGMGLDQTYYSPDVTDGEGNQTPLTLTSVALDKLYYLRNEVNPDTAEELLAWAFLHSESEARSRGAGERESREKTYERVKLDLDLYDLILGVTDRVRTVEGNPRIGMFDVLRFAMGQFVPSSMDDATLDLLWRKEHGDLSEAEMDAFRTRGEELRAEGANPNPAQSLSGMSKKEILEAVESGEMDPLDVLEEEVKGRKRQSVISSLQSIIAKSQESPEGGESTGSDDFSGADDYIPTDPYEGDDEYDDDPDDQDLDY